MSDSWAEWNCREQEVVTRKGRIIVTEEGIVFTGGRIPLLTDPVDALRDALDEIIWLKGQQSN